MELCRTAAGLDGKRDTLPGQRSADEIDGVFGLHAHDAIVSACGLEPEPADGARLLLTPHHTAFLRISDGCDNRCSYCTIPMIRGPFRSRPADDIVVEDRGIGAVQFPGAEEGRPVDVIAKVGERPVVEHVDAGLQRRGSLVR